MNPSPWEIVAVAAISVAVSTIVGAGVYRVGNWFAHAIGDSFGDKVGFVVAPKIEELAAGNAEELAHVSTKVMAAIDELRATNYAEHVEFRASNTAEHINVQNRLVDVEHRLAAVENRLGIRPPDARTRATDMED